VGLSPLARLLYIALWCEADREGRLVWKPRTFKMRYFPGDKCDIDALCNEILDTGLVAQYGECYAYIPTFHSHQHINPRESQTQLPTPDIDAIVTRASRVSDAQGGREGKGKEGKGKEGVERATRLQADFQIPDDWVDFCQSERPDLNPAKTFEGFKDYWVAKAGKDGAKRDWLATWRNWIRNQRAQSSPVQGAKTFAERDREAGIARWEEMTGRVHPDRQKTHQGHVIDVTPPFLELGQ